LIVLLAAAAFIFCLPFMDRYGDVRRLRRAAARTGFMLIAVTVTILFLLRLLGELS
jgi:quinol-cytochrome oxidoreductase complex cytochrome b subunit